MRHFCSVLRQSITVNVQDCSNSDTLDLMAFIRYTNHSGSCIRSVVLNSLSLDAMDTLRIKNSTAHTQVVIR